ncbi:hypothetical protein R1sor_026644 [Riccia sorocarpa]|uniref:Uncharacterized protein n=1 Tax=Riccia sorocarpa TaxID=122646 RepID=A0ABD3GDP3_9MARC
MAPKKKDKVTKTPQQTIAKTTMKKTTPSGPSNPSSEGDVAKMKMGPCKLIALPTTELKKYKLQIEDLGLGFLFWRWDYAAEPLVKEFVVAKSHVALPHRGKSFELTIEHWRKALGRTKEEEEPSIVWDTAIQRLNMPEGVNPNDLFQEKRSLEGDKNGYKTKTYADPLRRVIDEALMALFCSIRMTYLVVHKNGWLTAEERSLYGEEDPYSKITVDYSSLEDDDESSNEKQTEKVEEGAQPIGEVVKDIKGSEEDQDMDNTQKKDGPSEGQKAKFPNIDSVTSHTSPNFQFRKEGCRRRRKGSHLYTTRSKEGPSRNFISTPEPTTSVNITADFMSRYFVIPFATIEEVWKKLYQNFTLGPDHVNTMNELLKHLKDYAEHSGQLMKAHQRANKAQEDAKAAETKMKEMEKEKTDLEARMKELEEKMDVISKEKEAALEETKTKDMKIQNLQVQWIDRQEVEDKEVIIGNLRDAIQTILDAMKEVPMKDKKKTSFACRTSELRLREYFEGAS